MTRGYPAAAVRAAEAPLLEAGEPLMLRAAAALAGHARRELRSPCPADGAPRVLVLAGPGSNGGDGLHAAALLRREGLAADALAVTEGLHAEGAAALRVAGGRILRLRRTEPAGTSRRPATDRPGDGATDGADGPDGPDGPAPDGAVDTADLLDGAGLDALLAGAPLVLDAILGIGGRPELSADIVALLDRVRRSGCRVLAVDLPSGLDATTGTTHPATLAARCTVTFGAVKAGMLLPAGARVCGTVRTVDLGLGPHLPAEPGEQDVLRLGDGDVRRLWPGPDRDASKYTRGVVALLAGSTPYPGAAVLSCSGAARAGAGMVRLLAPGAVRDLVLAARPEVVGHEVPVDADTRVLADIGRTHALVVGPGLAPEDPRCRWGIDALRGARPAPADLRAGVIDAGALAALAPADRLHPDVVLTPHRGEGDRLLARLRPDDGDPGALPAPELARALAAVTGATVLLKGAVTLVAPGGGGPLRSQDDATAQLATAGTGDVLAGILGTLLAAGLPGPEAAALAALLHGRAGRRASRDGLVPLVALDVADHLPAALAAILAHGPDVVEGSR